MTDDDPRGPELSDLVVSHDVSTLARLPVRVRDVEATLEGRGMRAALRIARALPRRGEHFDDEGVDRVLVAAHLELQRLHEEFANGARIALVVRAVLDALRAAGEPPPYRVVDVGAGLGYVVRWLAAEGRLGGDVELLGVDFNARLVRAAEALRAEEGLPCRFEVANAFTLDRPAHVYTSSGVLHHFRGDGLRAFFARQVEAGAAAFVHFDIQRTWAAPLGSWLFHTARMRVPLARHDGYVSALRAHDGAALAAALLAGAPSFRVGRFDGEVPLLPIVRVMAAAVGVRPALAEPLERALGRDARRLAWEARA